MEYLSDREFTLNYQADLIVKDILDKQPSSGCFCPKVAYATFNDDGYTEFERAGFSDLKSNYQSFRGWDYMVNREFSDVYYRSIFACIFLRLPPPPSPLNGKKDYSSNITYVRREDQADLCSIVTQMLHKHGYNIKGVCFCEVVKPGLFGDKKLGYRQLCVFFG